MVSGYPKGENMNKTSIYIHTPYCKSKCRYCDFHSFAGMEDTAGEYFSALRTEIAMCEHKGKPVDTVFFGGGTPSLVDEKYILRAIEALHDNFDIKPHAEITIETNPGTLTKEKLSAYRSAGINRISMGMQSHDDKILSILGRIHNSSDIIKSVDMIKDAGFENFNLDVMCALPTQRLADLERSLRFAAELEPTHISAYSLIIEEGTPFYDEYDSLDLPDEEEERKMYHLSKDILSSYGYERYEVSNYAKEGYICLHNKYCWDYEDYIGFGSAAHSFVRPERWENTPYITEYINRIKNSSSPATSREMLSKEDMKEEYIMLALRKTEGLSVNKLRNEFGYDIFSDRQKEISSLIKTGYLALNGDMMYITEKGFDVADSVTLKLI